MEILVNRRFVARSLAAIAAGFGWSRRPPQAIADEDCPDGFVCQSGEEEESEIAGCTFVHVHKPQYGPQGEIYGYFHVTCAQGTEFNSYVKKKAATGNSWTEVDGTRKNHTFTVNTGSEAYWQTNASGTCSGNSRDYRTCAENSLGDKICSVKRNCPFNCASS